MIDIFLPSNQPELPLACSAIGGRKAGFEKEKRSQFPLHPWSFREGTGRDTPDRCRIRLGSGSALLGRMGVAVLLWYFLYARLWEIIGLMVKLGVSGEFISSPNYIRNYLSFLRQISWLHSATIFQSVKCLDTFKALRCTDKKHYCHHMHDSQMEVPICETSDRSWWPKFAKLYYILNCLFIRSSTVSGNTLFYKPHDTFCWYWLTVSQVYLSL